MSWHNMKLCIILQTVSQAMQGVDILIAVVSTFQLNWVYWEIFECMIEDNLMESCTVILKLVDDLTVGSRGQCITANNALQNSGFVGDKWKGNACKCFSCDKMIVWLGSPYHYARLHTSSMKQICFEFPQTFWQTLTLEAKESRRG